jgi:replicative DNA helicase
MSGPANIPPLINIEAEQGLLGAVLLMPDVLATVETIATVEDFSEPVHQALYARLIEARDNGQSIDIKLVASALGNFGVSDICGMSVNHYVARLYAEGGPFRKCPGLCPRGA